MKYLEKSFSVGMPTQLTDKEWEERVGKKPKKKEKKNDRVGKR